uniref:Uncharacterized protein n=1 Tax=Magnetospirillum gryphiswaldense TaxID=55518 RepID=A4TW76_9PROT|nr:hypothetical protein MGR_1758 [Magnetospirillum gryphiswaldense MSR-1]
MGGFWGPGIFPWGADIISPVFRAEGRGDFPPLRSVLGGEAGADPSARFSLKVGVPAPRRRPMPKVSGRRVQRTGGPAAGQGPGGPWIPFLDSRLGKSASVLVEKDGQGFCGHYCPVRVTDAPAEGRVVTVRLTHRDGAALVGEPTA